MCKAIISVTAITCALALTYHAVAQSVPAPADVVVPAPGQTGPFPPDAIAPTDRSFADIGASTAGAATFLKEYKSNVPKTRNARDIAVYNDAAPAVVLVETNEALGSGSLLADKTILTNWHVVRGYRQVVVVFKPADPLKRYSEEDMTVAEVIKIDSVRDLALLRPKLLPSRAIKPIQIAAKDSIEVGADVHAIGHPKGEAWTYTVGIVSQIHPDYAWTGGKNDVKHRATVIQTQTPINPGSSGGPLLGDDGQLVGVNSFYEPSAQGVNFAVSAKDVRAFLGSPVDQAASADTCEPRVLFEGRSKTDDAFIRKVSLKCDDRADITFVVPDDKRKPIMALVDISRRDQIEGIVLDQRRNGNWNISFWDPELQQTFPLQGIHPDGALMPARYKPRCPPPSKPLKDFECT